MRRAAFFAIIGLGGAAILIWLGTWQMQRLAWKQGIIADIEARIVAEPVALPDTVSAADDSYLPVIVTGQIQPEYLRVLVSQKDVGAGYRIIAPLIRLDAGRTVAEGNRILVDLGFVPADRTDFDLTQQPLTVTGNLQWPQETDSFTPEPDKVGNIWFARDVDAMAATLNTKPVLVVARVVDPNVPIVSPLPVNTALIPNDHLQYAITWFSLAAIWLAMSAYFLRRRSTPQES